MHFFDVLMFHTNDERKSKRCGYFRGRALLNGGNMVTLFGFISVFLRNNCDGDLLKFLLMYIN